MIKINILIIIKQTQKSFNQIFRHKHRKAVTLNLYHEITESQNGRGWKGPLWVI